MQNVVFVFIAFVLSFFTYLAAVHVPFLAMLLDCIIIGLITTCITVENFLYELYEIKNALRAIWKSLFSAFFICLQDILIVNYSSGTMDTVGKGLVSMFFFNSLIIGISIAIACILSTKRHSTKSKVVSIPTLIVLLSIYVFLIR